MNNPLKYADPSGELAWFVPVIAGAIIGAYTGASIQSGTFAFWSWKSDAWKGAIGESGDGSLTHEEYLKSLGYKYYPKIYLFVKNVSDDMVHAIRFAAENHYQPQYYYLKTAVTVASKSLNEILYEVTEGMEIADLNPYFCWTCLSKFP